MPPLSGGRQRKEPVAWTGGLYPQFSVLLLTWGSRLADVGSVPKFVLAVGTHTDGIHALRGEHAYVRLAYVRVAVVAVGHT